MYVYNKRNYKVISLQKEKKTYPIILAITVGLQLSVLSSIS